MAYLKIVKKIHECFLPTGIQGRKGSRSIGAGSVWACPGCDAQWIVDKKDDGELFWRKLDVAQYLPNPNAKVKKGECA